MRVDEFDVELLPGVVDSAYHPEIIAAYVDHDPIHCGSRVELVDTVRTEKLLQVREYFGACYLTCCEGIDCATPPLAFPASALGARLWMTAIQPRSDLGRDASRRVQLLLGMHPFPTAHKLVPGFLIH